MAIPVLKGKEDFEVCCKQMKVYTKLHGFESVLDSDEYVEIGAEGSDKMSLVAKGMTTSAYERQLVASVFLSQALESNADRARFHRTASARRCWEEILDWYDTTANAQKETYVRGLYNIKIGKQDDPVEKFYETEDLRVKLLNAGMTVDDDTLHSCFVSALPSAEYALETRDFNLKQVYNRKEILNLVRKQYETLLPSFGKGKGSNSLALVSKGGRGDGGKGGQGGGRGKAENKKDSVKCWRCRPIGHYSYNCTTRLWER